MVDPSAIGASMNRDASPRLRHLVDDAVGPGYDVLFVRLDLLVASREARCGCRRCVAAVARERSDLVAALPPLPV